jgi:hypothetical protein
MARKKRPGYKVAEHNMKTAPSELEATSNPLGQALRSSNKAAVFEELARSLGAAEDPHADLPRQESDGKALENTLLQLVADVGTGLWRLQSKQAPAGPNDLEAERRTQRHLQSLLDTLVQAGVEIRDHTGELVPRGGIYTLNVLAYEPRASLATERVLETIKPTIYFKDRVIQVGQVIIGTPTASEDQTNARRVSAASGPNIAQDSMPEGE